MKRKILAAKLAAVISLSVVGVSAQAGIPVTDVGNAPQHILAAMENVAQTLKQIEQYQTQLQQYENQLRNTLAPAAYIWDQAQRTMDQLVAAQDTLTYYQNKFGSLDKYLEQFQDVSFYRSSPCFNGSGGCTPAEKEAMAENRRLASEAQKRANDALFHSVDSQQSSLKDDARQLERLQSFAQGAEGQLEAIGYANQFASNQANQLLQLRSMLAAQHNAEAAKAAAELDDDARSEVLEDYLLGTWKFKPSPESKY